MMMIALRLEALVIMHRKSQKENLTSCRRMSHHPNHKPPHLSNKQLKSTIITLTPSQQILQLQMEQDKKLI